MPASLKLRGKKQPATGEIKPLTQAELNHIDKVVRHQKGPATVALNEINKKRIKAGMRPVEKSCVHRYVKGETYSGATKETRGRKRALAKADVRRLDQARRRLLREADNDHRVTYSDVMEEAGLEGVVCQRVCEDALRKVGVGYRVPRRKIYVTEEDAKIRKKFAEVKLKWPASFWSQRTAYQDTKKFPLPLTPKQRKRMRQTQVTGHLRKPSEGLNRGFTKPRDSHSFIGMPSVGITAAVAKDRIIMWQVHDKNWCGASAADMYQNHLRPALVRTFGKLDRFRVVEDGDRKGHYSNKGIAAKKAAKILPVKLPPRTPSLMPLDYALWKRICDQLMEESPEGPETKEAFLKRLKHIALSLPKSYVKAVIAKMRPNLKALADAQGWNPKND